MCFVDRGGGGGRGPSDWLRYASPDAVEAGSLYSVEWNGGMERWNEIMEWNGGIVE